MLPASARTAASYLGGGIARGLEQQGGKAAQAGQALAGAAKSGIGQKVGGFLETVGSQVQQLGATAGQMGGVKKRDLGLAAAGLGMTGAFVGGMGANAGVNSLAAYFSQDNTLRQAQGGTYGSGAMPQDLQRGYISLNQFGSPLGLMNIQHDANVQRARYNQGLLRASVGPQFNQVEE